MTRAALWTRHRGIAYGIAAETSIVGLERDDIAQEALLALWLATAAYRPELGPFPVFARVVVKRRLLDLLERQTRKRRDPRLVVELEREPAARDERDGHEQLSLVVGALDTLNARERRAVADHLAGRENASNRSHENALQRARAKLRAAAA